MEFSWHDISPARLFGRGWSDTTPPFGRLPARAEKFLPEKIWRMGRNSSGMYAQFETDSDRLAVHWELEDDTLREPLFNVCAHSGLDLYRREWGRWLFTATLCPFSRHNEEIILRDLPPARRRFRLYFPFRNCVSGVAAGVSPQSFLRWDAPEPGREIVYYGSSIVHGSYASRAGMGSANILGRLLDRPVVNLGFSGEGKLEPGMAGLLAELSPAAFLIDPLPNMDATLIEERLGKFLRELCSARRDTPVVLVTNVIRAWARLYPAEAEKFRNKRDTAARIVRGLAGEFPKLCFLNGERSMGGDCEGTVDGLHPNDLGSARFALFLRRFLKPRLG
ncbi:MAG: hypothetical protein IJS01_01480 [Lentisphaeria bacterium]|nr:hypothetical protein [Lentisphaeria bacterium]